MGALLPEDGRVRLSKTDGNSQALFKSLVDGSMNRRIDSTRNPVEQRFDRPAGPRSYRHGKTLALQLAGSYL
jgi:hypothetical protein